MLNLLVLMTEATEPVEEKISPEGTGDRGK